MAKWLMVLLALGVVVAGLFYVWRHQPLQEALEAAQRKAADEGRELTALRSRVSELEAIREGLERAGAELKERIEAREKELAACKAG
jgi:transposase-like protein